MSETFGGAMRRYFGDPPEEFNLEERLKRDMATLERDMKKLRRKRKVSKSRARAASRAASRRKTKYVRRNCNKTNRTMKRNK
jgi:hypothetical protein